MRPTSILWFERLYLAAFALSLVSIALSWESGVAMMEANPNTRAMGAGVLAFGSAAVCVATLLLWWFAAHRRSVVAKWLISIWFVISTVMLALTLFRSGLRFDIVSAVGWAVYLLRAWAVSYLFKPDAETWFAGAPEGAASAEA
ncbi:hypothetical protein TPR58_06260 [Sphingomonas sp. HF-S3]|uniref:DUF2569 domain-containing protein n=1 Tax=Sphingomonas rustica TaxID=3103142 RepID=A0ABV0B570_9SPHN